MTTPIPNVDAFPGIASRPSTGALAVTRGDSGIGLEHPGLGLIFLSPEQCLALEEHLAATRAGVDAAIDAVRPIRTSFRASTAVCECCGMPIAVGDDVAVFPEVERSVVMHWGRCPEPALWAIRCRGVEPDGSTERTGQYGQPLPYEDAFALAAEVSRFLGSLSVRLVRVRSRCTALVDVSVPSGVECTYRKEPCGRAVTAGDRCERHQEVDHA